MIRSQVSRRDAIAAYLNAGFELFPCKSNKTPAEYGWQTNDYDAADLGKIYGVRLTDEIFVLDVDPRRYDDDGMTYKELMVKFGIELPIDTYVVKSGGEDGGMHVYFRCPPGRRYKMYVPGTGKAIECKSLGRFVVGAGSIHPKTGDPYRVFRGSPDQLADAPEALLEWCEAVSKQIDEDVIDDTQANQDRFIKWCLTCPAAIEGQGGNNQTYAVACTGSDFGLPEDRCFAIMLEYFNSSRCYPKWEKSELRRIVANAYEYVQNSRGCNALSVDVDELSDGNDDEDDRRKRAKTGSSKKRSSDDDDNDDPDDDTESILHGLGFKSSKGSNRDSRKNSRKRMEMGEFGWDFHTLKDGSNGPLKPTCKNLVNLLLSPSAEKEGMPSQLKDLVGFNELSHRIEFNRTPPWRDYHVTTFSKNDYIQLKFHMATRRDLVFPTEVVEEAVVIAAMDNRFNPLVDWLDTLKWDGKKRLDTWLTTYCGADDNPYVREVARITLISAIARAYIPGCKVDTMTILEGPQGIGKGTLVAALGGEFATSMQLYLNNVSEHKQTIMKMLGKWIAEIPEMTFAKKQEIEAVKAFLTTSIDNVVLPWGKNAEDIKRTCIFIGTFNPTMDGAYLNDASGNRRYLPVRTKVIDIEAFKKDRDQLLAEAKARFEKGEQWYMTDTNLIEMAKQEQSARTVKEVWTERIEEYISEYDGELKFSMLHLARVVLGNAAKADRRVTLRIGKAMRELGYIYHTFIEDGQTTRYWIPERKKKKKE